MELSGVVRQRGSRRPGLAEPSEREAASLDTPRCGSWCSLPRTHRYAVFLPRGLSSRVTAQPQCLSRVVTCSELPHPSVTWGPGVLLGAAGRRHRRSVQVGSHLWKEGPPGSQSPWTSHPVRVTGRVSEPQALGHGVPFPQCSLSWRTLHAFLLHLLHPLPASWLSRSWFGHKRGSPGTW